MNAIPKGQSNPLEINGQPNGQPQRGSLCNSETDQPTELTNRSMTRLMSVDAPSIAGWVCKVESMVNFWFLPYQERFGSLVCPSVHRVHMIQVLGGAPSISRFKLDLFCTGRDGRGRLWLYV